MINPNYLTITGLLLAFIAVFMPIPYSLILFSTSFILDVLDGRIARKYHMVTKWGGFLDSVSDKIVEVLFIYYISVLMHTEALGIIAAGLSLMVSYMKHRSGLNIKIKSFFDRPARMIAYLFIFIVYLINGVYAFEMMLALVIINSLAIIQLFFKIHGLLGKVNK